VAEASASAAVSTTPNIDGFDLVNCIATGNVSQVWEVKEVATGQSYAMKLLLPEAFSDPGQKAQIKHEARIGKACDHPNLIRVYEVKTSRKHCYFTMELFRGANLKGMIRSDLTSVQVRAKKIMEGVTQALAHLHEKGWAHKDVKPENILITRGGDVRLIDFSLTARSAGALAKAFTRRNSVIIQGTRTYIAPELIRRNPATTSVDMYSLGITLYEMLTGRPPFIMGNPDALLMAHIQTKPETPSLLNPNLAPECDRLVLKMLAKRPKDRPTNMQEVYAEIRSINFFKTDMQEHAKAAELSRLDTFKDSMGHRLDSRTDAGRTPEELATANAGAQAKSRKIDAARKAAATSLDEKTRGGAPAAAPHVPGPPPMPAMMPGAFPMAPGFPMPAPGYPMPGMPMPGMPMPGFPMPGFPMPGQQYPPPMPMPTMPMHPAMPGAGQGGPQPATAAPQPQAPAPAQPAAQAPPKRRSPRPVVDHTSIPMMEEGELPDVQ